MAETDGRAQRKAGMAVTMLVLIWIGARIGSDIAGTPGVIATVVVYLAFEALLFWGTRSSPLAHHEPRP